MYAKYPDELDFNQRKTLTVRELHTARDRARQHAMDNLRKPPNHSETAVCLTPLF